MEWSAEVAMREMWSQYPDTWRTKNGDMMCFFKTHLQTAFDSGKAADRKEYAVIETGAIAMQTTEQMKALEDGIRKVFRLGGEEMARSICVGEFIPFGEAVIAEEKALAATPNRPG